MSQNTFIILQHSGSYRTANAKRYQPQVMSPMNNNAS